MKSAEQTSDDMSMVIVATSHDDKQMTRQVSTPLVSLSEMATPKYNYASSTKAHSSSMPMTPRKPKDNGHHHRSYSAVVETPSSGQILREYSNVTENVVRKKKFVEETIDKVVVVPQSITKEEEYDEIEIIREKIVEVAKPTIKEVYVEVPKIEHREEIVEVEQSRIEEKCVHVEKVDVQEVINYVPRVETVERIVEVEQVEYVDVEVEKIVEVPEYREEVVIVEKPVPRYVEKIIKKKVDVEVEQEVSRIVPHPVEIIVEQQFNLPTITPQYQKMRVPLYVPRFIEVPVPAEMLTADSLKASEELITNIHRINTMPYPSLCELEELAAEAKNFQLDVEEDPEIRFRKLADHLDTKVVVVNNENGGSVVGRKVSVTVHHRDEL